ncbi:hypothetical protein [Hymenobacter saemangeumensis]|uniref:hypothetical protein n=1 Tax=Hymenobacter saemangeumensis TaxID=1084522 RepID=UPI0031F1B190
MAGLINRRIAELMTQSEARPGQSLRQRLRAAELECCYDAEAKRWMAAGSGLTGSSYAVLLNQQGLLSLAYTLESTGAYSWEAFRHVTFDLRTGRELQLFDLVAESPEQLEARMRGAINRRFGEALAKARTARVDSETLAYMTETLHWNQQAGRVRFGTEIEDGASPPDFQDFALTPKQLLIFYSAGFHRLRPSGEPDATYRFPYTRLRLSPLLQPLLLPEAVGKSVKK